MKPNRPSRQCIAVPHFNHICSEAVHFDEMSIGAIDGLDTTKSGRRRHTEALCPTDIRTVHPICRLPLSGAMWSRHMAPCYCQLESFHYCGGISHRRLVRVPSTLARAGHFNSLRGSISVGTTVCLCALSTGLLSFDFMPAKIVCAQALPYRTIGRQPNCCQRLLIVSITWLLERHRLW